MLKANLREEEERLRSRDADLQAEVWISEAGQNVADTSSKKLNTGSHLLLFHSNWMAERINRLLDRSIS
jgi:hypothetical protein